MQTNGRQSRGVRSARLGGMVLAISMAVGVAAPAPVGAATQTLIDPAGDSAFGPQGGADVRKVSWTQEPGQLTLAVEWVLAPQGDSSPADASGRAWLDTSGDDIADYGLFFATDGGGLLVYELHSLSVGAPGCQASSGQPVEGVAGERPMSGSPGALQSWSVSLRQSDVGSATSFRWAVLAFTRGADDPNELFYDYVPDGSKGDVGPNPGDRTCGNGTGFRADLAAGASFPPPPPANQPPVARFTVAPGAPRAGESVSFDGSSSNDPDGSIVAHVWDLDGDGAYDDATGPRVTASLPAGPRQVGLRVTDNGGAAATARQHIVVECATARAAAFTGKLVFASRSITGTMCPDILIGSSTADRLDGLGGDDVLVGLGGFDLMDGGSGDDTMSGDGTCPPGTGGAPYFCVPGGPPGSDRMFGGSGADAMRGHGGNDRLSGQGGDDRIWGSAGNDRLTGGTGHDVVDGGSGNDRLKGGSGRDRLTSGTGRDIVKGGSGSDRILARDRSRDRIDCGTGRDTVIADRFDKLKANCERRLFR